MQGLMAVFQKEFADHFSSKRFVILFTLICLAGLSATYVAAQSIRGELLDKPDQQFVFLQLFTASSGVLPPFISFIGFLGPLVGIALGFDAINSEKSNGTLSRVLSQPIFRDSVINGKFLAGLATISLMLLSIVLIVAGLGLRTIGVAPSVDEAARILVFLVVCIVYVAFWMALSILFSVLFRQTATSALAGIAAWIFFVFFISMISGILANTLVPLGQDPDANTAIAHEQVDQMVSRISPSTLFQEATVTILTPGVRTLGPVLVRDVVGMIPNPLSVSQSLLVIWPQIVGLIALTSICFAISYAKFLREEIRA
ncbi:MAG: ABC transporter permease [Chloroflexi bacterium]|nr:ABC transporter permease [Chloroflexota bacterium]MDA8187669.1 ABC transporter permease subunit [Dehalococcoidales bacterium]